jgi:hypothetical protein
MDEAMKFLWYNIFPICCLALVGYIISMKADGWGWCLFIAVITASMPSSENSEKK